MKANKLTKVLLIAGLVFSLPSQATSVDLPFSFTTIADVAITEDTPIDFGTDLAVATGSNCTMSVSTTSRPSDTEARLGVSGTPALETSTYEDLSGNCDDGAKGTAGIYLITGAPGFDVTINVNTLVGTDINFVGAGVVGNYNDAADGDTLSPVVAGTDVTVSLPTNADGVGNTGGGFPVTGETRLFLGGTVTARNTLAVDTTITEQFFIDANY